MSTPSAPERPRWTLVIGTWLVAGAMAGAATGTLDGLWSWRLAGQFTPNLADRLRFLLFLAGSYGAALAIAAVVAAKLVLVLDRWTRLGWLVRRLGASHARARRRDPAGALVGLSLVLAGVPCTGGALAVGFAAAARALASRKHTGLTVAVAMGAALAAVVVGVVASFVVARPIELALRPLARRPALGRALSSPRAPLVAGLGLVVVGGAIAVAASWQTLALVPLRPLWVALVALALFGPAHGRAARFTAGLARRRPLVRWLALPALLVCYVAASLVAGGPKGVAQAATAYSGLGGPLARLLRPLGDLDRDGYSRFLGGGDCDDRDPDVNPGMPEIPDDGIDNNCVGGDLTTVRRTAADVGFAPLPPGVPPDASIVLLTIDALRADHLGAYGYARPTSPHLDALARQGVVFENGWAHAPSTRYSMPAILTGRYPLEVRYVDIPGQWPGISEQNTTIAELLHDRGFATMAVTNYWYFDELRHMNQGFDSYDNSNKRLHSPIPGQGPAETRGSSSREQTDKAIAAIESVAGRRFFLWVHYYDPHADYQKHPPYDFGDADLDRYDSEIRYTDEQIGRLLGELEHLGLGDKTIVMVTGDHGDGFGEHGIFMHGYHLYGAQTRVPFILKVPGIAPARLTTPVGHVDILPTLANLAGAAPSAEMMGRSLVAALAGHGGDDDHPVFQELSYEGHHEMRAAANQRCHVIYNVSPDTSWEVYRIDRDRGETHDLSGDPGDCAGLVAALGAWYDQSQIPPDAVDALLPARPAIAHPLDADFGDEIRLLAVDLPATARRGEHVDVTYTFEARGRLRGDWRLFVHFEGPGSRFQGDHEPARPFTWWRAGQFIRYQRSVEVPATAHAGRYAVWLGVFRGNQRRPARGGLEVVDDRVRVGELQVVP